MVGCERVQHRLDRENAAVTRCAMAWSLPVRIGVALATLMFMAAATPLESNGEVLRSWLAAFNSGGAEALTAFEQRYFGDSNIESAQDDREESGGFDLVKIESNEPLKVTALLRERNFPSDWRITIARETPDATRINTLDYHPLPMSQLDALAGLGAFADRLAAADKFSGVIAIFRHGEPLLAKAWGLADRDSRQPVTLDTPFLLASSGKMFTGVAVLQLIEQGKVSLSDPMGKYLTDYPNPEAARKVTVRDLLTHQDGLGDMRITDPEDAANRAKVHSIADIIKLNGSRRPAFEPGTKVEYANYGYLLLGDLTERVTGQSYYDYVTEHILRMGGMTHTGYPQRADMRGVAVGYTTYDGKPLHPSTGWLPWRGTPAGGGVSTAGDMLSFVAALNSGKLLSNSMLAEATRKQAGVYGYGFLVSTKYFPFWGHGGQAPGNSVVLNYYPITDTTFVCMSNRDPPICDRLANDYLFRAPRTP